MSAPTFLAASALLSELALRSGATMLALGIFARKKVLRREEAGLTLTPRLGRSGAGAALHGRF